MKNQKDPFLLILNSPFALFYTVDAEQAIPAPLKRHRRCIQEVAHRGCRRIEKQQEDNGGGEEFEQSCHAVSTGKQSPSKYRRARWGLFERTGGDCRLLKSFFRSLSTVPFIARALIRQTEAPAAS
jgi:hypothetical protein